MNEFSPWQTGHEMPKRRMWYFANRLQTPLSRHIHPTETNSLLRTRPIARMDDEEDDDVVGIIFESDVDRDRFRLIRERMMVPACLPTEYSGVKDKRTLTNLVLDQVTNHRVPTTFRLRSRKSLCDPLAQASLAALRLSHFPDHLFSETGSITQALSHAKWEADSLAPSGEAGISLFLKTALFDLLNQIVRELYRSANETRGWKPIGIGGTGRCDYGFFVNCGLVAIVELKPHCVSSLCPVSH